jgi:hypothetical protein
MSAGPVWYVISDGDNREAGLGTFNGTDTITRDSIQATLVNGVYNGSGPAPLSLTGTASVASSLSAEAFGDLWAHIWRIDNPHNTTASLVVFDNSAFPYIADNVQAALEELLGNTGLTFIGQPDTPDTYVGKGGWLVRVRVDEMGLEFIEEVSFIDLTVTNLFADSIQLTGGTGTQGTATFNADSDTWNIAQNGTSLPVGQELQLYCKNVSGGLLTKGTVVMAVGTDGASGKIHIAQMDASNKANAKYLLGIIKEDLADNEFGVVVAIGKVFGLDTSAFAEGDVLWADTTTPGALTSSRPSNGIALPIAFVVRDHATTGILMVRFSTVDENALDSATPDFLLMAQGIV